MVPPVTWLVVHSSTGTPVAEAPSFSTAAAMVAAIQRATGDSHHARLAETVEAGNEDAA